MSMESHVLFRGTLPAKAAVNAVLRELAFPFSIAGRGALEGHHGFMPMKLRGRMLVVRPVRHILRGAYLDGSSDRFSFNIQRYLIPLYGPANSLGGADRLYVNWHVWEPDFQAQLIDKLADAVFAPFGKVSTLADFAETMIAFARRQGTHMQFKAPVTAFILAGEPDRAAAYLDELERQYADHRHMLHFARQMRAELDRDVSELCAEHHAKEAATAAALELGEDWEPTPFPVEVPKASRVARCADGIFTPTPWMVPPDGLFQDLPEQLGEVCFAIDWTRRQGRPMLVHPLTSAQAQERHQRGESYHLLVRLPPGDVTVFIHYWGLNPADPNPHRNRHPASYSWIRLSVLTPTGGLGTDFHVDWDHPDRLSALGAYVDSLISRDTIWRTNLDAREGRRSEHDFRREPRYASYDLTEAELARHLTFTTLFGDDQGLLRRAADFIRMTGYGHLLEEIGLHL